MKPDWALLNSNQWPPRCERRFSYFLRYGKKEQKNVMDRYFTSHDVYHFSKFNSFCQGGIDEKTRVFFLL